MTDEETETTGEDADSRTKQQLPLRYVISMRDEYIAQMDPLRRFVGRLDESSYHLKLLEKEQAKLAIQKPAVIFGYTYERDCFTSIIQQLTKEERFVEPAHLQLVCEKLWNEKGRELASINAEKEADGQTPLIRQEVFKRLGETKGILKSFFKDFLKELGEDEQQEALEMLAPLVTSSGTRNIIERDRLVNAPLRDSSLREKLLSKLVNHTLVRTEHRLGGYFVEITHEFLIGPILEAIGDAVSADPEYNRYRLALRAIERLQGTSIAGTKSLLTWQDFAILHQHRDIIRWNVWSAELMLRTALASKDVNKETLTFWVGHCGKYGEPPPFATLFNLDEEAARREERELLSLAELRVVNSGNPATLNLSAPQVRLILSSELAWATDEARRDIIYWTERMKTMPSKVISIAEEFLRSSEPQHRKNALTALGVIGNEDSVRLIAETTIGDDDAGVRQRAREEIGPLFEESRYAVLDVFEIALWEDNEVKQQRAYAALGQLKSKGLAVPKVPLSWRAKLRLAAKMHTHFYLIRNFNFRMRSWLPALCGSLVGGLFLVWGTRRADSSESLGWGATVASSPLFLILMLGAIILAVGAAQRTTPINSHISRLAAIPFEILISAITGFLCLLVFYIILNTVFPDSIFTKSYTSFMMILFAGVLAGAVRGATIMAFGIYYRPKLNWMTQVLAGTFTGYLVGFLVSFILWHPIAFGYLSYKGLNIMLSSLPLSLGCACAFAAIDSEAPPGKGRVKVVVKALRAVVLPVLLILNLLLLILLIGFPRG